MVCSTARVIGHVLSTSWGPARFTLPDMAICHRRETHYPQSKKGSSECHRESAQDCGWSREARFDSSLRDALKHFPMGISLWLIWSLMGLPLSDEGGLASLWLHNGLETNTEQVWINLIHPNQRPGWGPDPSICIYICFPPEHWHHDYIKFLFPIKKCKSLLLLQIGWHTCIHLIITQCLWKREATLQFDNIAPIEYWAFNEYIVQLTQGIYLPLYIKSHHDMLFKLQEAEISFGRYIDLSPSPLESSLE